MGEDTTARAEQNIDDAQLRVTKPRTHATGWPAIRQSLVMGEEEMGAVRTMRTLLDINQTRGFDCMSCAWPDPDPKRRSPAEFCESGAKAVAEEATKQRATPEFFAAHSIAELETWDDFALGKQGRITHPMLLEAGDTHYRPVTWDRAIAIVKEELQKLESPDEAVFYTSGRASNEAAFTYGLFARSFGTNNLPDCSNMCHESTSIGLAQVMGVGKASVSLTDLEHADLILIAGQNPGTNAPRMLTRLENAKKNGGRIVAINPLREAGLLHFDNPQSVKGLVFRGTQLADEFLQIKLAGDQALFQALGATLIELDAERGGTVLDHDFIARYTSGFEDYRDHVARLDWAEVERATGLPEAQIRRLAGMIADAKSMIICWAMGITQHVNGVATIRDMASVAWLTGNVGRPGAGLMPVRGHSNVQGDRTVGIWEKMPDAFHDRLSEEFSFTSPKEHGYDTVKALQAMRDGKVKVFMGLGGNYTRATPDTERTEASMRELDLTVQISTKPNRSHVVHGKRALILPCLGRTERDVQATGPQRVSVEDTVLAVHESHGHLEPASPHLRSEVAIICGIAEAVLEGRENSAQVDWSALKDDYRLIRKHIEHVVDGFQAYEEKLDVPGGFVLPHPPRDKREFPTKTGKAMFTVNELEYPEIPEDGLVLQTLRSHDQFNTTIYGKEDRYRGIHDARRVVLMNRKEMVKRGLHEGDVVDLVSTDADGVERRAVGWRAVPYRMPSGNAAAYFPEANVLLPLHHTAKESNSPAAKAVVIRVEVPARSEAPVPAAV
ncbi:FdhF/YdeP family oxidoreductase [Amnibacterium endophyticum]|uniref:FdhF/YdeP family oxidoreductase n=1 Tax=Amnibacterium endophyticum TaxID=2109337 RepID=A0ABW4LGQ3_9MICO